MKVFNKRFKMYRRFDTDIWGFVLVRTFKREEINNIAGYFYRLIGKKKGLNRNKFARYIYRVDIRKPKKYKKRKKWNFISKQIIKLFYLTLKFKQHRRFAKIAARKEGSFETNFILIMEGRLIMMLYRMQFILNIFILRRFIVLGNVLVNGNIISSANYQVKLYDLITLKGALHKKIHKDIITRVFDVAYYCNIPRYIFVSYKLMFGLIYKEPRKLDLAYPNKIIDIYRGCDINF